MKTLLSASVFLIMLHAQTDPTGAGLERGTLPEHWATGGPDCQSLPKWETHAYNESFYIMRESGCTHYEKPFLYLIFGTRRVMLIDTGAGNPSTSKPVEETIAGYVRKHNLSNLPLVVAHTHGHDDHTAGDRDFSVHAGVTVVPVGVEEVKKAFGIDRWPDGIGSIDLGNRVIEAIPIPGHDPVSLAFYDARTGILLTGDTLYPGRLYVEDFPAYLASIKRLVSYTAHKHVAHILGNHIEQTSTPYLDYPVGTKYQPQEHELPLARAHLLELDRALDDMQSHPVRTALRDFTVWPKP
ncbi:MAG: beta-lactamase domain protein [Bryobacterales bacterium]|nr:beta-lactamase domain protein [Bryobacterales bacterium]